VSENTLANRTVHVVPRADDLNDRVDRCLAAHVPALTRSQAGRLAQEGAVRLGGRPVKAGHRVREGDRFEVLLPESPDTPPQPEEIPLSVVYEDEYLLVVDKPRNMVVHPAAGNRSGTLVNALLSRGHSLSKEGGEDRPGIVHRLDRHTSGVMLVAKDDTTHARLKLQLANREMRKEYVALVNGAPPLEEGRVEARLDRHPLDRKKRGVTEYGGREAVTDYRLEEILGPFAVVCALPHTGRTHQVRVHLAHLNCPVVGDATYGGRKRAEAWAKQHRDPALLALLSDLSGQALHARSLGFTHPATAQWRCFEAPLPADMARVLAHLRQPPDGK